MNKLLLATLLAFCFAVLLCTKGIDKDANTLSKFMKIAISDYKKHYSDINDRFVEIDSNNFKWKEKENQSTQTNMTNGTKMEPPELVNRKYQVIIFRQKELHPGGDFLIFIDTLNFKVIYYFGEK
jgi:sulfite reductase alpha subunit-like flavoprotein